MSRIHVLCRKSFTIFQKLPRLVEAFGYSVKREPKSLRDAGLQVQVGGSIVMSGLVGAHGFRGQASF